MKNGTERIQIVYPFNKSKNFLGNSKQGIYLYEYFSKAEAKSFVLEEDYIDKDYLIDYSKFYARSFSIDKKYTRRLHFFSKLYCESDFEQMLQKSNIDTINELNTSYLGFVVMKPINDSEDFPLLGRTLIKPYYFNSNNNYQFENNHQVYLKGKYRVSLFGIPLIIESLPFQIQDTAVGACATVACWTAQHPLSDLFGVQKYSPFEVTEMSVSIPSVEERNFPNSTGLTLLQMKGFFNSIGLETEFIDVRNLKNKFHNYLSKDDVIADAVRAYTNMKLPIIAALRLEKKQQKGKNNKSKTEENLYDYHAVVISGYSKKNGNLDALYIHDDQIGPYSQALPHKDFTHLKNKWIENGRYSSVIIEKLMIPIYPKIRLSFNPIYNIFLDFRRYYENRYSGNKNINSELLLMENSQYKKFLWEQSFEDKKETLYKPFPRFLWITRSLSGEKPISDMIYDGTGVYPKPMDEIYFKY